MRDFLIAAVSREILGSGVAMGKGIAVDEASHETKKKTSQKLTLLVTIVKLSSPSAGLFRCPGTGQQGA
jgi:hypothetical protein